MNGLAIGQYSTGTRHAGARRKTTGGRRHANHLPRPAPDLPTHRGPKGTHDGAIIGHALAADSVSPDGRRVTDIGVVIADHWQSRGVGSVIMGRLVARAAARGVSVLAMDVLPENRPMLAMISRRWADAQYEFGADSVTVRVLLSDAPAAKGTGRAAGPRAA